MIEPECSKRGCRHFDGVLWLDQEQEKSEVVICSAFPKGIPEEIAYGRNLHIEPFPGDQGIRFEPMEKEE